MTPFEAVFGKPPPSIPSYIPNSSSVEAADTLLRDRDELLSTLRAHMMQAQERMKMHADKKRSEKVFEVGQYCYVRLQPHKQTSLAGHRYTKLSKRFYGPFKILKRVGVVAYKLELPPTVKIHPIFHISVLKACPNPAEVSALSLPVTFVENQPLVSPLAILNHRRIRRQNTWVPQLLVQWSGLPLEDTSWEDLSSFQQLYPDFHLEGKVLSNGGSNVTCPEIPETREQRPQRTRSAIRRLVDFISE
ncbi:uncharacterized protein LOC142550639 [Primulina tabacum]|uniref:uncharacterized protein LOC142550639 n=1 Tax=Primulina tabacum TaxID=48773 RepID=UPI003F597C13